MASRRTSVALAAGIASAALAAVASAGTFTGPSSSASPYLVNAHPGVDIVSILTVGDSVNAKPGGVAPYKMVGIPDGLGAYDNGDGTFTLLMNHELGATAGITRQHGSKGAFVSQWTIRKSDLKVLHGGDLVKQVYTWDAVTGAYVPTPGTTAFGRLCSADLPAPTALYNRKTGKGYAGRIFMDGEEVGNEGRAFAHIATGPNHGISYELPYLGKFSWENSVASPHEQDKTIVIGMDDSTPGQVYVYVGEKRDSGTEVEKAGLHGGTLYGIKVAGIATEARDTGVPSGTAFSLQSLGDVHAKTGAQLQTDSVAAGVTEFLRPEDGAWDTRNPNVFYFVTTDRFDSVKDPTGTPPNQVGRSRLYRLTFHDIGNPALGGRIDQLLDGTAPYQMLDNITVDRGGNVIIQEDPGNQAYLARVWLFNPRNGQLVELAQHDPARFKAPQPAPFNQDEESSGVIEITSLLDAEDDDDDHGRHERRPAWYKPGHRYFLGGVQAHYTSSDPELVEGGQLFLMIVPNGIAGSHRD